MQDSLTGSHIGGYRIGPLLEQGGMGSVYQAALPDSDNLFALKLILPEYAEDQEIRERFMREIRIMQSLQHPNIMPVYAAGEEDGILYYVMPFVRGPSVHDLLSRRRFSPLTAWQILSPVAEALDYAHARGVIHRDIKPGNLLIEKRATVGNHLYLLDFGLSKLTGAKTHSRSTVTLGTPHYMAPEQVLGKPSVPQTDIYSLGVVLYELLLGRLPFVAKDSRDIVYQHINATPPAPHDLRPDFPKPVESVLLKALAKKPAHRYQTAGEFRMAYARAVEAIESSARRTEYWVEKLSLG